jgi:hypothetical protein
MRPQLLEKITMIEPLTQSAPNDSRRPNMDNVQQTRLFLLSGSLSSMAIKMCQNTFADPYDGPRRRFNVCVDHQVVALLNHTRRDHIHAQETSILRVIDVEEWD